MPVRVAITALMGNEQAVAHSSTDDTGMQLITRFYSFFWLPEADNVIQLSPVVGISIRPMVPLPHLLRAPPTDLGVCYTSP